MRSRVGLILSVALFLALAPASAKELSFEYDYPIVSSRWGLSLGGYLVDLDTTVSVGFGEFVGTTVNLEELLDLEEDQKVLRLDGFVRLAPKHSLDFGLLEIKRNATTTLANQVIFDEFQFAGDVSSSYDIGQFKMIYKYSFLNNGRVNTGFSTGLSWFNLEGTLVGNATLLDSMGNPVGVANLEETGTTLLAPVPSIGMFVDYAVAKWFIFRMEAQFFDVLIGDIDFKFMDTSLLMEFYFTRHVGIGIGLNNTSLKYVDSGEDPLSVDFRFGGVVGHLGIAF